MAGSTATTQAPPLPLSNAQIGQCLADARWLIINYGWRQHIVGDTRRGFSVDGAILAAADVQNGLYLAALQAFRRTVGGFEPGPWNDHFGRTRAEVNAMFLEAEKLARRGDR